MRKSNTNLIITCFTIIFLIIGETNSIAQNNVWGKVYSGETELGEPLITNTIDGGMALLGKYKDSQNMDQLLLTKLSSDGAVEWSKFFENTNRKSIFAFIQTADGNFVCAGNTETDAEFGEALVMKFDSNGKLLWQNRYSGNLDECLHGLAEDKEGNIIAVGNSSSSAFKHNMQNGLVMKLDKNGKIIWQKNYGQTEDAFYNVFIENDAYILCGNTSSFGSGAEDYFVMKIKLDGTIVWQKAYGAKKMDLAYQIKKDKDGNYIIAGNTGSFKENSATNMDLWVVKIDNIGNVIWDLLIADPPLDIPFSSFVMSDDGNIIITGSGYFKSPKMGNDLHVIIVKISNDGKIVYQKRFNSDNNEMTWPNANSLICKNGGYIFCAISLSFNKEIRNDIVLVQTNDVSLESEKSSIYTCSSPGIKTTVSTLKSKPNNLKPFVLDFKEANWKISMRDVSIEIIGK